MTHCIAPAGLDSGQLERILDRARWAPSGDNIQQWRVRPTPSHVEILVDHSKEPALLDVDLQASLVAVGAFIESIRLAASELGIEARVSASESLEDTTCAVLTFRPGAERDPLAAHLEARHSNRRLYAPDSCDEHDMSSLLAACDRAEVDIVRGREQLAQLAEAVSITDRVRMRNRRCHEEFHTKIRWRRRNLESGYYYKTFEIKGHEALSLRLTRPYWVSRFFDPITRISSIAASLAARQVTNSGAVLLLRVPNRKLKSTLTAGANLQRMWLAATGRGLACQALAVLPLMAYSKLRGGPGFGADEMASIDRALVTYREISGAPPLEEVSMMLRVGRAPPPSARTSRFSADSLLI